MLRLVLGQEIQPLKETHTDKEATLAKCKFSGGAVDGYFLDRI